MPKVSVVVPIYNVEKYLRECLDSILSQTLKDIEIICVNDGSKDSSLDILKEYKKKDDRIVIIDKPNSGYGASVNLGISKARSDYIGIVESDDFIREDMYETLYNIVKENDVDLVKSNWYEFRSSKKGYKIIEIKSIDKTLANKISSVKESPDIINIKSTVWAALYKKSFLDDKGIKFLETPGASYQDASFCFKVFALASKIYFLDEPLVYYRQDNLNSSIKSRDKVYAVCTEYEEMDNILNNDLELKKLLFTRKVIIQHHIYCWNLRRIHQKFRKDFVAYFSNSFKKIIEDPYLDKDFFFKKINSTKLKLLIEQPDKYYKIFVIKHTIRKIRKFIFTLHLGKNPCLIIFGIKFF